MDKNMLINFYTIMIAMRFDIKNKENKDLICILMKVFNGSINNKEMCDAIVRIMPDWKARLKFEESEYYFIQKEIMEFIRTAMRMIKDNLNADGFDIAYDITDMLHALPDIIIQQNKKQSKRCWRSYWKIYVDPVYKKWKCHTLTKYKKFFMFGKKLNY